MQSNGSKRKWCFGSSLQSGLCPRRALSFDDGNETNHAQPCQEKSPHWTHRLSNRSKRSRRNRRRNILTEALLHPITLWTSPGGGFFRRATQFGLHQRAHCTNFLAADRRPPIVCNARRIRPTCIERSEDLAKNARVSSHPEPASPRIERLYRWLFGAPKRTILTNHPRRRPTHPVQRPPTKPPRIRTLKPPVASLER